MVASSLYRSFDRGKFYCLYKQLLPFIKGLYKQLSQPNNCLRIQFSNFIRSLNLLLLKKKERIKKCALRITTVQQYCSDANHKQLTGVGHGY